MPARHGLGSRPFDLAAASEIERLEIVADDARLGGERPGQILGRYGAAGVDLGRLGDNPRFELVAHQVGAEAEAGQQISAVSGLRGEPADLASNRTASEA